MALSLLVTFLYGSMVWGILPLREHVSWESHLMGMLSGIVLALTFKNHGPQRPYYSWELEELEELEDKTSDTPIDTISNNDSGNNTSVVYHYTGRRKERRGYGRRIK